MAWSPSSVRDFQHCPRYWWLKRQGVEERARDETAMELGTEFHARMARHWSGSPSLWEMPLSETDSLVHRAIEQTLAQEGDALREQGIVGVEVNLDGDDAEAARHGRYPGTCDLITNNGEGLTVTDYKTKYKMEAKYADGELRQTQRSWQLYQYAWFVQQKYGRPVTSIRKLLVAFTPAVKVWLVAYPMTYQQLSEWYSQAVWVWAAMDQCKVDPQSQVMQNEQNCERYGWNYRCGMYHICWEGAECLS